MSDRDSSCDEVAALRERYARRATADPRYALTDAAALRAAQERQRGLVRLLRENCSEGIGDLSLLEVGCGTGGNLLELLWLGFSPQRLAGIELLADRHATARQRLPESVRLTNGDATSLPIEPESFDLVYVSTVFSSLLDDAYQARLSAALWAMVKPGGAVLWYDFVVGNPQNRDVRGVSRARVRALFPLASVQWRSVTLAPPLARAACRVHPALYTVLNALAPLRTHVLGWLGKAR
jgi:SAM-dependent methyltransferase